MKIFLYICIWIVGIDPPMKVDSRTPFPDTFVRDNLKTGIMKTINLSQGQSALVDDEDYEYLNQWKWCASNTPCGFYALRKTLGPHKFCKNVMMHRAILNPPKNMQIDHIDHNGLNNQKSNLRICNAIQNAANRNCKRGNRYHGVRIEHRTYGTYIKANIKMNGKLIHLGMFKTEESAARAYDTAAREYYGEFAHLNFKD